MTKLIDKTKREAKNLGIKIFDEIRHVFPKISEVDDEDYVINTIPDRITVSNLIEFLENFKEKKTNISFCEDRFMHVVVHEYAEKTEEEVQSLIEKALKKKEKDKINNKKRKEAEKSMAAKKVMKLEAKLASLKKKAGIK